MYDITRATRTQSMPPVFVLMFFFASETKTGDIDFVLVALVMSYIERNRDIIIYIEGFYPVI
jgi:hypothetical protein